MSDFTRDRGDDDQQQREAELVRARLMELAEEPIQGKFDLEHLQAVHAYIFQDLPQYQPGVIRERTEDSWAKARALEGQPVSHVVHYAHDGIEDKLTDALRDFGGPDAIKGQPPEIAAAQLAALYGDLDYAHGFYEGNSRTLREFTRELALEAGFDLDWIKTDIGAKERNELYVARDLAVLERAFPDLTPERAMQTDSRAEWEASFHIEALRAKAGDRTLETIIGEGLTVDRDRSAADERFLRPPEPSASIETGVIMVFDQAADVLCSLAEFVAELFAGGGGERPKFNQYTYLEQIEMQERDAQAIINIRARLEHGDALRADDVRSLTPEHLKTLSLHGDDAMRELVSFGLDKGRDLSQGWER